MAVVHTAGRKRPSGKSGKHISIGYMQSKIDEALKIQEGELEVRHKMIDM